MDFEPHSSMPNIDVVAYYWAVVYRDVWKLWEELVGLDFAIKERLDKKGVSLDQFPVQNQEL